MRNVFPTNRSEGILTNIGDKKAFFLEGNIAKDFLRVNEKSHILNQIIDFYA